MKVFLMVLGLLSCSFAQTTTLSGCTAVTNSICTACSPGYQLVNGQCQFCQFGYVLLTSECVAGPTATITINNSTTPNTTTTVVPNLSDPNCQIPQGSICVVCYPAYIFNTVQSKCIINPNPCQIFNGTLCLNCYDGFALAAGVCLLNITANTQSTSTTQSTTIPTTPTYVDKNCKQLDATSTYCVQCYPGYYYQTRCIPTNPLCKNVTSNNQCTDCFPGFSVLNGNCVPGTFTNTSGWSSADPNCQNFSAGVCQMCYKGYYPNKVMMKCTLANPYCKEVSSDNTCTDCYAGYQLANGNCNLVVSLVATNTTSDSNCKLWNSTLCLACYQYYYFNITENKCKPVNPLCKTFGPNNNCLTCFPGYILSQITCVILNVTQSPPTDQYCTVISNGICTNCSNRYYLLNNVCTAVDPFCAKWASNGVCLNCYTGYVITLQGSCIDLNTAATAATSSASTTAVSINNCATVDANGLCTKCVYRYWYDSPNNRCLQVSDQCNTWSNDNGKCLTCYKGYTLSAGACVNS